MKEDLNKEIELPEGVTIQIDHAVKIIGPQGEVTKRLTHPRINISHQDSKIIMKSLNTTKKEKKIFNSFQAHLKNMIQGVIEKHVYKLKICSGHFPMTVSLSNNELTIKNFFGENTPRKLTIKPNVEVKVEGTTIIVISTDKEAAGQVAADIERLTKIKNRDMRIFQDGCYITHKAGKDIHHE